MSTNSFDWDDRDIKHERQRARDLRDTQWWKRKCAKGICHYCHATIPPRDLTMDHIVPLSRGGRSTKGNVVACCKACNNKKKHLLPMEWEAYLESIQKDSGP